MMRIARPFLALLIVSAVVGCNARTLSSLHDTYDDLRARQKTLPKGSDDIADVIERDDVQSGFSNVAKEADALAKDSAKPETRIVAWRLGTISAWQARLPETQRLGDEMQAKGATECGSLTGNTLGAPRDCAILAYLPFLQAYETVATAINRTRAGAQNMRTIEILEANVGKLEGLQTRSATTLPAIYGGQPPYKGISPVVVGYFVDKTVMAACLASIAATRAQRVRETTPRGNPLNARARTVEDRLDKVADDYNPLFVAVGLIEAGKKWREESLCSS
jgi:hypothetical protein